MCGWPCCPYSMHAHPTVACCLWKSLCIHLEPRNSMSEHARSRDKPTDCPCQPRPGLGRCFLVGEEGRS